MAFTYWPSGLPQAFQNDGYGERSADNTIEAKVDHGPSRLRRVSTANMTPITGTFIMNDAQKELFDTFSKSVEAGSFWFPKPLDDTKQVYVRMPMDGISTRRSGLEWAVSLRLEVWPHAEQ